MSKVDNLSLYNEKKAAEVAVFFLMRAAKSGMNITKLRLIKWLYLAERSSYEQFGEPMIGDRLMSMQHGPVLSNTLHLVEKPVRAKKRSGAWESIIGVENAKHQYMFVKSDSGYENEGSLRQLSDSEMNILRSIWRDYAHMSAKELETLLHSGRFPEWKWDGRGANPIELESLLPILGFSENEASETIESIERSKVVSRAFAA